ncbi:MAG: radical SAM protein [Desulfobacterales bacterium]|nr:radical SAM protein [Desulfobacterales bacterium]
MDVKERKKRADAYLGATRSTCPRCLALVNAKVLTDGVGVYFDKYCPDCGHSRALVSEDAAYYLEAREFARPGSIPLRFATKVDKGCPGDCGLCPDHQQHTCHPIVEITDRCNLRCPICMADNQERGFLPAARFREIVDNLIAAEGAVENITLSGGEPSLHPDFHALVDIADRPEVDRVSLVTNGLRIAEDPEFCDMLKARNVYVILQWDGFDDDVHRRLRGRPLMEVKERALARLEKRGVDVQLVFVAARGVNEDQLGRAVRLTLDSENILSLVIQPLALTLGPDEYSAPGGPAGIHDPLDRITIPGVIRAISRQTEGLLKKKDFIPLPCPDPRCVSLTYLLRLDNGAYTPFPRFVDMKKYLHLLSHSATIPPNRETEEALHEIINDLWSSSGQIPDCDRITGALRRAALEMFPPAGGDRRALVRASERQAKSIFIHHYMDRYNFDLSRVVKCCHHYPRADGRITPVCAFNLFHRQKEENPFVA